MKVDIIVLSIPVFFALIGLEIAWDAWQKRKGKDGKYRLNDAVANISCGIVDQVTGVFAKVFTIGAYTVAFYYGQQWIGLSVPHHWSIWILLFVLNDLAYYWAHRISHGVNLFWTGHVVHHQSEDYNLSVALRQGAFQKVFTFWVYLPLALIGFPPEWFLVSGAINLLYQFWIHTEMVDKMGWFEEIFNTPSHHRVHHGRNPKYIDKNHAGVFIIWDRMFGTFQREEEHPTYGITVPLKSFSAVEAHIRPFGFLWEELKQIPSWSDKFRYLFKPPGWYPQSMGGFKHPQEIDPSDKKFEIEIPIQAHYYTIFQYLIALGITSLFLFNLDKLDWSGKVIFTIFILYYLLSLGSIFNGRTSAKILEAIRLAATVVAAWWMSGWLGAWLFPLVGTIAVLSLAWLYFTPFKKALHESLS